MEYILNSHEIKCHTCNSKIYIGTNYSYKWYHKSDNWSKKQNLQVNLWIHKICCGYVKAATT